MNTYGYGYKPTIQIISTKNKVELEPNQDDNKIKNETNSITYLTTIEWLLDCFKQMFYFWNGIRTSVVLPISIIWFHDIIHIINYKFLSITLIPYKCLDYWFSTGVHITAEDPYDVLRGLHHKIVYWRSTVVLLKAPAKFWP